MRNIRTLEIFLFAVFLCVANLASAAAPDVYDIKIVELVGRPGHQGLFPIQGQPIGGAKVIVQARVDGFSSEVNVVLRNSKGLLLSKIPMIAPPADKVVPGTYFAEVVIPMEPFIMSISGVDQTGSEFEGLPQQSSANTPQAFDIRIIPTIFEIPPEFPVYFSVRITNYGKEDTFSVKLISDVGGTIEPESQELQLDTNQSADIQFRYTAPTSIEAGFAYITFTATASSMKTNDATNQAILELPTPMHSPGKLMAWLSIGEQGMLGHNRKVPLTVWLCNDQIDNQTILIANQVSPSGIKIIPKSPPSAGNSGKHIPCTASSRLKLEFDPVKLIATLRDSIGLTSKSRLAHIPISALSTEGISLFGYIPLVLEADNQPKSSQPKSSQAHDHAE